MVNTIFTTVYTSKLLFLAVSFLLYIALIYTFPVLYQQRWLHLGSFTTVIGQAIIPIWLFQGMEDMKYLAVCNIVAKVIYFLCVLLYIRLPGDYVLVNLFQGLSAVAGGWLCLYIAFKKFKARLVPVIAQNIKAEIKSGKMLFFRLWQLIFTSTPMYLF